jgi:hypothetical protein
MIATPPTPTEHVGRGALLALFAIPAGIVVFVAISSIGIFASIVSFGVAFAAYWLYQRGAGGIVTRAGAWVVTSIVVVTIVLSLYFSMVWQFATAVANTTKEKTLGASTWDVLNLPGFWPAFNDNFSYQASHSVGNIIFALALGALGSYRILRRAFAMTSSGPSAAFGARPGSPLPPPAALTDPPPAPHVAPQVYENDVDAPPTGSADDKTAPPSAGV